MEDQPPPQRPRLDADPSSSPHGVAPVPPKVMPPPPFCSGYSERFCVSPAEQGDEDDSSSLSARQTFLAAVADVFEALSEDICPVPLATELDVVRSAFDLALAKFQSPSFGGEGPSPPP